jgi:hypothetical protein
MLPRENGDQHDQDFEPESPRQISAEPSNADEQSGSDNDMRTPPGRRGLVRRFAEEEDEFEPESEDDQDRITAARDTDRNATDWFQEPQYDDDDMQQDRQELTPEPERSEIVESEQNQQQGTREPSGEPPGFNFTDGDRK